MFKNSFLKELSGEIINIQTTLASLGLSVLVLAFSIIGLASFQPAEASDAVVSVIANKPQVLGTQDYPMQVLYSSSSLDLAVTPYGYDSNSGKWNYKVSWNRKTGAVGNININGNVLYKGAEGINEVYTGYNLDPNTNFSLSYAYSYKSGRKSVTKVVTKKNFTTYPSASNSSSQAVPVQSKVQSTPNTQYIPIDPYATTISVSKPTFGEVIDKSMHLSLVIFSPKADTATTAFYSLLSQTSNATLGETNIPFTTVTAGEQQGTLERYLDTTQVPNGTYTLNIGVDLKNGTKLYAKNITVVVNHQNSNSFGVFSITSPTASSTWVGDGVINIVASGSSVVGFTGQYSTYIDSYQISTGSGQKSADSKTLNVNTSINNIPSSYIFGISQGPHTLLVKAGLSDGINSLSDTKTIIYYKASTTTLDSSITTVRVYSDDINEDGVVDYKDLNYLNSLLSGSFGCPSPNNCDVNGDGYLTIADAIAFRQVLLNRYDLDKNGLFTYNDYIKMGDVVPGAIACPVTTCDFTGGGGVTMEDWTKLGKILSTFPDIVIY